VQELRAGAARTPEAIAKRNQINEWIRTSGVADAVVDFHAALRDPIDPDRLRPELDSGDHLHPNAAGYAAMAEAVDLSLLSDPTCGRADRTGRRSAPPGLVTR
jgi:lysophospholipase L1-like esterase